MAFPGVSGTLFKVTVCDFHLVWKFVFARQRLSRISNLMQIRILTLLMHLVTTTSDLVEQRDKLIYVL